MQRNPKRIVAAFCGLALTASALAGTVTVNAGPYQAGSGGEFMITPSSGLAAVGLAGDVSDSTFQSFCIESNEYLSFGSTYDAVVNTAAVSGGSGGGNPDPLDPRSAYLYWNFRMGTLAGYNFGGSFWERKSSAEALQKALWYIENEVGGENNAFVALAGNAVSSGAWSGLGNVRVLNLTDCDGQHQDILSVVPAPAGLLLGAIGLAGALGLKRKLA